MTVHPIPLYFQGVMEISATNDFDALHEAQRHYLNVVCSVKCFHNIEFLGGSCPVLLPRDPLYPAQLHRYLIAFHYRVTVYISAINETIAESTASAIALTDDFLKYRDVKIYKFELEETCTVDLSSATDSFFHV